jgi:hypothetical protein
MAWVDAFADMLTDTISYSSWVGMTTDGYGNPTFSTDTSNYACRIGTGQRLVRNFDGIEEMATTTVWVASTSTFDSSGRFTLPDTTTPPLLSIETYRDEYGVAHSKLGFGV